MQNQNIKRGRGRPKKYSTEEERKNVLRQQKSKYMLDKEWYCDICKNGKNYTLAGKSCHLKTKKHEKNHDIKFYRRFESIIRRNEGDEYWEENRNDIKKCSRRFTIMCMNECYK